ncbi:MAG: hypothetical protein ACJ79H_22410 [Myxococcales bacterium]
MGYFLCHFTDYVGVIAAAALQDAEGMVRSFDDAQGGARAGEWRIPAPAPWASM